MVVEYVFPSLAVSMFEVILSIILLSATIIFILIFYGELIYMSFDEEAAKISGIKVGVLSMLMMILTATR